MKLRDLINELTKIAEDAPDADVKFQTVEAGTVWFPTQTAHFLDARPVRNGACMITLGPSEVIAADYKRCADNSDRQKKL